MPGLTLGYDAVVELSHGLLNRAVGALYDAGIIPDHWEPADGQELPLQGFQIFLAEPNAAFAEKPGEGVVLSQRFIVRADAYDHELNGSWSAFLPIGIDKREESGKSMQFLRCECSGLTIDDVVVTGDELGFLALFITVEIHKILTQQVQEVPISAPMPGLDLFVGLGKGDKQTFLSMFVNLDGRVGGFTDGTEPLVPQDVGMSKPDVAVAVDQSVYVPRIKAALAKAGLVSNTKIAVNKGAVRKVRLTRDIGVEFVQDAIRITGGVDVDIKNWPDVTGDFTFTFAATLAGNKLKLKVTAADVDIDSLYAKIVSAVLLGPFGLVIEEAVEAAVEWGIESAVEGQSTGFNLPVQSIFIDGVQITNAAKSKRKTVVFVEPSSVTIRPDCLILKLNFRFKFDKVPHAEVTYYRAHLGSREFHKPDCSFGAKIAPINLVLFPTPWAAFADGYDGCAFCLKAWNGDGTGELELTYTSDEPLPAGQGVTASFAFHSQYKYAKFTHADAGAATVTKLANGGFRAVWKRELLAPGVWEASADIAGKAIVQQVGITGGKLNKVLLKTPAS